MFLLKITLIDNDKNTAIFVSKHWSLSAKFVGIRKLASDGIKEMHITACELLIGLELWAITTMWNNLYVQYR